MKLSSCTEIKQHSQAAVLSNRPSTVKLVVLILSIRNHNNNTKSYVFGPFWFSLCWFSSDCKAALVNSVALLYCRQTNRQTIGCGCSSRRNSCVSWVLFIY